ncbi:uncharacterized protein [Fopius arisanus]|uniref:DapF protein n=1 Tax=Fopius arisanus TaxID=64838 RepID=A0A0C9R633_9HYME|nr:PREDICTED: uncharacterized protein LOC105268203 [Fopius arisanus]XP_011305848.1 PREDICTED: uncharacterized protein LOC105268203 [Fopius arisanus]
MGEFSFDDGYCEVYISSSWNPMTSLAGFGIWFGNANNANAKQTLRRHHREKDEVEMLAAQEAVKIARSLGHEKVLICTTCTFVKRNLQMENVEVERVNNDSYPMKEAFRLAAQASGMISPNHIHFQKLLAS